MPENRKLAGPIHFPRGVVSTPCNSFSRSRLKDTPHGVVKEIITRPNTSYYRNLSEGK